MAGKSQTLKQTKPRRPASSGTAKKAKLEHDASAELLAHLKSRADAGKLDDCPLPELYRHLQKSHPALTFGQFHDLARRLSEQAKIYLHPWTGPLYEIPEPACALLVGHEVAYYASLRL